MNSSPKPVKSAAVWRGPKDPSARRLVTPEGVNLSTRLADVGIRIAAFAIDIGLILLSIFLVTLILGLAGIEMRGENWESLAVLWQLAVFGLRFFYFTMLESGRHAATWGKRLMKIRVASRTSPRLAANAVFVRNAMRELEIMLPIQLMFAADGGGVDGLIAGAALLWAGVFLFFPLFNRDRLRAGDLLAGTWVVRAPRPKLLEDLSDIQTIGDFAFTPAQVDAYGVKELHVLEDLLCSNDAKILSDVANRIRTKIGWTGAAGESDRAFLDAYYRALRERLESRLIFGVRRRDKHDRR